MLITPKALRVGHVRDPQIPAPISSTVTRFVSMSISVPYFSSPFNFGAETLNQIESVFGERVEAMRMVSRGVYEFDKKTNEPKLKRPNHFKCKDRDEFVRDFMCPFFRKYAAAIQ